MQHAIEALQNDFAAKRFTLEVELPERPIFAFADDARIVQIVINLLNNALKVTSAGGRVHVRLADKKGTFGGSRYRHRH